MWLNFVCTICGHRWIKEWQPKEPRNGERRYPPWYEWCPNCHLLYGAAFESNNPGLHESLDGEQPDSPPFARERKD
jgi:hypothetical protein